MNYKTSGMAFIALGAVFMPTVNVALGAAFLAIGAALISQHKSKDADRLENGDES
ncbi:MAG: hypothetical protein ABJN35_03610 [Erythrobacter sp.]